jgi:hypothetical protein
MAGHVFLDMPSSVVLGIVEMQIHHAAGDVTALLSVPSDQANNHIVDKVRGCERRVLSNQMR